MPEFHDIADFLELVIFAMLAYAKPFFRKLLGEVVSEKLDEKLAPVIERQVKLENALREIALEPREIERTPTSPISVDFGAAE
jgi:hypothetical protein